MPAYLSLFYHLIPGSVPLHFCSILPNQQQDADLQRSACIFSPLPAPRCDMKAPLALNPRVKSVWKCCVWTWKSRKVAGPLPLTPNFPSSGAQRRPGSRACSLDPRGVLGARAPPSTRGVRSGFGCGVVPLQEWVWGVRGLRGAELITGSSAGAAAPPSGHDVQLAVRGRL